MYVHVQGNENGGTIHSYDTSKGELGLSMFRYI